MTKFLLLVIGSFLFFTSCSEKSYSYRTSKARSASFGGKEEYTAFNSKLLDTEMDKQSQSNERKVIYNASLELQAKQVDSANANLMRIAHRYEGYVLRTGPEKASIRVRSEKLNNALDDIARLGKVRDRKVWGDDVTEEYADLEIRLDNFRKTRLRYLDLLQKANNVEETLKVEKELERLNREIDLIEGKMNRLSHLTDYSTIDVYYKSRPKPGILGYVFIGVYKGVKWLFVRG